MQKINTEHDKIIRTAFKALIKPHFQVPSPKANKKAPIKKNSTGA